MLIYDTITIHFEGKNTFDLSVPCESAHHKLYKNSWIVGIGPSKQKLWLMELEKNHNEANCMDVNLWYDHDKFWGGKHFSLMI